MTIPTQKIAEGWGWQHLWEPLDTGHHEFSPDRVKKVLHTDIGAKIIMASRFMR